jgi:putative glycosyltransferase (TIGR04372 family)
VPADLDEMGIKKDNFVLFSHASKNYYEARLSTTNFAQNSYRHYDLSSYEPAITKLIESNFKVIRVGVQVDELPNALKALPIIDYTGQVRTEIGELWLYENCKFLLSATSGAYWFARRFDRPTLLTNSYALPLGYFSTLYTPMTFRNVDTGKLLSLVDMFDLRKNSDYIESHFMRVNRLELVPNSASTILNSVNDVLDLSNEEIKKTSENLGLIKRYESILISFNVPIVEKMTMPALSFLKEYSYLLE